MNAGVRSPLTYAARPRVVARYLGRLALSLAVLVALPLGAAVLDGKLAMAWRLGVGLTALLAMGIPLGRLSAPDDLQTNEAAAVVVLPFVLGAAVLAWGFSGAGLSWADAVFEAASSVTTTGLTVLDPVEAQPASVLFTRAWGQWYGGAAILVLAVALLLEPGVAGRRVGGGEAGRRDFASSLRSWARRVLVVYGALTALAFVVFWLVLGDAFEAVIHALTSISTGGFSTSDASIGGFATWGARAVVVGFAALGAVSLVLYQRAVTEGPGTLLGDPVVRALGIMLVLVTLLLGGTMALSGDRGWGEIARNAPLLAISAQTTTGYSPLAVGDLDAGSKGVLVVSMLIGGDFGSTAGGIKLPRLMVMVALLAAALRRSSRPSHALSPARVGGRRIETEEVETGLVFLTLFLATVILSVLPFLALGHAPLDSLFDVASAVGTVGLSTGVVGPDLATGLKLVLSADMILGRIEVLAALILLYPSTWVGRRTSVSEPPKPATNSTRRR